MPSTPLSNRLRDLRFTSRPNGPINQSRVAEAIGVTAPSISAYENGVRPPSDQQLQDYAVFFASTRWLESNAPRRVRVQDLTDAEREDFRRLHDELRALKAAGHHPASRRGNSSGPAPFWRFDDGGPVRILCGRLDPSEAGQYGEPTSHNFMYLRNAADLDALVELWGHIRRLNPESDVRYVLGDRFSSGDLQCHVVVLGNIAQMQGGGRLLPANMLPIRQVQVPHLDGEIFEYESDAGITRFEPAFDNGRVVEDVGLLARMPNPNFTSRTFTICSGVFTRGVYGAVRCLTDRGLRDSNADYLHAKFGDLTSFGLLMRVRVAGDTIPTPELRFPRNRLLEIEDIDT